MNRIANGRRDQQRLPRQHSEVTPETGAEPLAKDDDFEYIQRSNTLPTQTEKILMGTVSQIWAIYDTDSNGWLDVDEMKLFVQDTLSECQLL